MHSVKQQSENISFILLLLFFVVPYTLTYNQARLKRHSHYRRYLYHRLELSPERMMSSSYKRTDKSIPAMTLVVRTEVIPKKRRRKENPELLRYIIASPKMMMILSAWPWLKRLRLLHLRSNRHTEMNVADGYGDSINISIERGQ
ncbi:MAG: hypothetical protein ACI8RD_008539 [Bacillariaceae sp.]|jgi:hypothetical protein